jgi:hypothetical protein
MVRPIESGFAKVHKEIKQRPSDRSAAFKPLPGDIVERIEKHPLLSLSR